MTTNIKNTVRFPDLIDSIHTRGSPSDLSLPQADESRPVKSSVLLLGDTHPSQKKKLIRVSLFISNEDQPVSSPELIQLNLFLELEGGVVTIDWNNPRNKGMLMSKDRSHQPPIYGHGNQVCVSDEADHVYTLFPVFDSVGRLTDFRVVVSPGVLEHKIRVRLHGSPSIPADDYHSGYSQRLADKAYGRALFPMTRAHGREHPFSHFISTAGPSHIMNANSTHLVERRSGIAVDPHPPRLRVPRAEDYVQRSGLHDLKHHPLDDASWSPPPSERKISDLTLPELFSILKKVQVKFDETDKKILARLRQGKFDAPLREGRINGKTLLRWLAVRFCQLAGLPVSYPAENLNYLKDADVLMISRMIMVSRKTLYDASRERLAEKGVLLPEETTETELRDSVFFPSSTFRLESDSDYRKDNTDFPSLTVLEALLDDIFQNQFKGKSFRMTHERMWNVTYEFPDGHVFRGAELLRDYSYALYLHDRWRPASRATANKTPRYLPWEVLNRYRSRTMPALRALRPTEKGIHPLVYERLRMILRDNQENRPEFDLWWDWKIWAFKKHYNNPVYLQIWRELLTSRKVDPFKLFYREPVRELVADWIQWNMDLGNQLNNPADQCQSLLRVMFPERAERVLLLIHVHPQVRDAVYQFFSDYERLPKNGRSQGLDYIFDCVSANTEEVERTLTGLGGILGKEFRLSGLRETVEEKSNVEPADQQVIDEAYSLPGEEGFKNEVGKFMEAYPGLPDEKRKAGINYIRQCLSDVNRRRNAHLYFSFLFVPQMTASATASSSGASPQPISLEKTGPEQTESAGRQEEAGRGTTRTPRRPGEPRGRRNTSHHPLGSSILLRRGVVRLIH